MKLGKLEFESVHENKNIVGEPTLKGIEVSNLKVFW